MNDIIYLIEDLRQKLYKTAEEKGIKHPQVLTLSQKLDEVLNIYNCKKYQRIRKTAV